MDFKRFGNWHIFGILIRLGKMGVEANNDKEWEHNLRPLTKY